MEGIRDLLAIQVELPELENPESADLLQEAVTAPTIFDSQLYLFETVGTLVSLLYKTPDQAAALLLSVVKPLLDELSVSLQAVKGPDDVLPILKVHHIIMALGNIAKGFPEYPNPVPESYVAPPLEVFREVGQAILVCLEAMNVFRVVRDAVSAVTLTGERSRGPDGYVLDAFRICTYLGHDRLCCRTAYPHAHG